MERINISGINFTNVNFKGALQIIEGYINEGVPRQIATANVDFVVKAAGDDEFKEIINTSDLVVADGMPVIWASIFLGTPLPERITGIDLALKLCELSQDKGYKVYFLGAEKEVGEKAIERLKKKYPRLNIAGYYSPPLGDFSSEEEDRIKQEIRSNSPHILFVCFTAGRQEKWIRKHMDELGVSVCIGVGSFLDFAAGKFIRAPSWAQNIGLEWFFRLIQDPLRLFKRYIIDDARFFLFVLRQKTAKPAVHKK